MDIYNRHYIRIDASSCIVEGWSDGPYSERVPTEDDICINERGGYQFQLFPGGESNPQLFDWPMDIPLYKWDGANVLHRSDNELAADYAAREAEMARIAALPTQLDLVEAQTTYTAMMTDTLLPEEDDDV